MENEGELGGGLLGRAAVDAQGAAGEGIQTGDEPEEGGFAAAAGADQADEIARGGGEVDPVEHEGPLAVALGNIVQINEGRRSHWGANLGGVAPSATAHFSLASESAACLKVGSTFSAVS